MATTAENLLGVIGALQEETGVHLKIRAHPDVLEFAEVLNSGLGKIPPITGKQGTVYRGYSTGDLDAFDAHYVQDGVVSFPAFTSASPGMNASASSSFFKRPQRDLR